MQVEEFKSNKKMSKLLPWIDEWIDDTETLSVFTKSESDIYSIIRSNWNLKDRIILLDSLFEQYGNEVKSVINKLLREKTVEDWKSIAADKKDNSIESFINTLWPTTNHDGFKYSVEKKDNTYKLNCTECPMAELATEIGGEIWIFELACMSDYYMVEGFNSEIEFKRGKTLVTGDKCCDHFYRIS